VASPIRREAFPYFEQRCQSDRRKRFDGMRRACPNEAIRLKEIAVGQSDNGMHQVFPSDRCGYASGGGRSGGRQASSTARDCTRRKLVAVLAQ